MSTELDRPLPPGGLSPEATKPAKEIPVPKVEPSQVKKSPSEPLSQEELLFKLIRYSTDVGKKWAGAQVGWSSTDMPGMANPACGWSHIACDPYTNEITKINLSNQHLKLTLASELSQLTSLTELNLEANQVSGTIPSFLFESFEKLEYLVLAKNDLQSTIPPLTESLKNLRVFDISDNRLRGEIPEDIGDVLGQNLEKLDLSHNGLTGDIPKSITKCKNLGFLDLSTNLLDGSIPKEIGDLKVLKGLFLNNNNLIGTIPFTLARSDLPLIQIFLENNDLSGTIPAGLSDLNRLRDLFVDGNKLTGTVPADLCDKNPPLNNEFFTGKYATPDRDGCTSIACPAGTVSVEGVAPCFDCDNGQYRYIGHESHQCLKLSQRDILQTFYDRANGLNWKGDDGWGLENVDICAWKGIMCTPQGHVVNITLRDMNLHGQIATELGLLEHLKYLDLANNFLTGYLPSDLRFAPLEHLDVSNNHLKGFVPPMFCLAGNVNGNGMDGQFNCDSIACPVGTYNDYGRMVLEYNELGEVSHRDECIPCKDSEASYIGATQCNEPVVFSTSYGAISRSEAAFGTVFAGIFLIAAALGVLHLTDKMRKARKKADIDRAEAEETLALDRIDYDFERYPDAVVAAKKQEEEWMSMPGLDDTNPEIQHPPSDGNNNYRATRESPPSSTASGGMAYQASRAVPLVSTGSVTGGVSRTGSATQGNVRRQDSENELWLDVPKII